MRALHVVSFLPTTHRQELNGKSLDFLRISSSFEFHAQAKPLSFATWLKSERRRDAPTANAGNPNVFCLHEGDLKLKDLNVGQ